MRQVFAISDSRDKESLIMPLYIKAMQSLDKYLSVLC